MYRLLRALAIIHPQKLYEAVFMSSVHIGGVFFCQTVHGVDVRQPNVSWLRSKLRLVSQESVVVDFSICENIKYGDNGRHMTMDEVMMMMMMIFARANGRTVVRLGEWTQGLTRASVR